MATAGGSSKASSTARHVIAFIGLGRMGGPMVRRLLGAGYTVRAFDVAPEALESVRGEPHCVVASSASEAASGADVLITMLPCGEAVRSVVLGGSGRLGAVETLTGQLVVDMSSSEPWLTLKLGEALRDHGIHLIDAPVSGGVAKAVDGTLAILVGGEPQWVEQARPILDVLGANVFHAGRLGSGHALKALNNLLSASAFAATIEALRVAEAYGIDPIRFAEIVDASTGSNNTTRNKLRQFVLNESYASGFTIGLMDKDLGIARELAAREGIATPLSQTAIDLWHRATEILGPDADHTAYAKTVDRSVKTAPDGDPRTAREGKDTNVR